jgi:hypothetical protein
VGVAEGSHRLTRARSGNEDTFQTGSYAAYRWPMFVDQLSKKFPELEFIATTAPSQALQPKYTKSALLSCRGRVDISNARAVDYHQYQGPDWFTNMSTIFDVGQYPRNNTQVRACLASLSSDGG